MPKLIVTDERRCPATKSARRFAVDLSRPLDCVACLRVALATRLRRAPCQRAAEVDPDRCQPGQQALHPRNHAVQASFGLTRPDGVFPRGDNR